MELFATQVIHGLSIGVIIAQVLVLVGLGYVVAARGKRERLPRLVRMVGANGIGLAFLAVLGATVSSLFLSEIAHLPPCLLCWYQRMLVFPQVILFGVALWKGRDDVADYGIALSVTGLLLAGYHYYGQMFASGVLPCAPDAFLPSCEEIQFLEFGYITIPMMSFTAFAVILTLLVLHNIERR